MSVNFLLIPKANVGNLGFSVEDGDIFNQVSGAYNAQEVSLNQENECDEVRFATFNPTKAADNAVVLVCSDSESYSHNIKLYTNTQEIKKTLKGWVEDYLASCEGEVESHATAQDIEDFISQLEIAGNSPFLCLVKDLEFYAYAQAFVLGGVEGGHND